jgi:ATP adenylyltransferase
MSDEEEGLLARVHEQTRRARSCGDLQPTATEEHEVHDAGIRFSVRVICGPDHKRRERRKRPSKREPARTGLDPFQPPYTDALFVAELSDTHVALLNKFPVLEDHLLVVTRADEPQQSWLTPADFSALRVCMQQMDGLGFYNGGAEAGASQPHKHLQLVPMDVRTLPLLDSDARGFASAQARIEPSQGGEELCTAYRDLMRSLEVDGSRDPYNVLVTDERIFVVPRTRHAVEGIALNAMGYAGSLLVRNRTQLERLREIGPVRVLAEAARPS